MPRDVLSLDQLRGVTGTPLGDTAANHKRQCMELCVLQGLSQVEAGRQLGVNKATVCRHLQKAKRALRRAAGYAGLPV